jgi:quercetin dioxygenase-like cupin family protein
MKGVAILGATGSIGRSTLAVLDAHPDTYRVVSLAARSDVARMVELCLRYRPEVAAMEQEAAAGELEKQLRAAGAGTRVAAGGEAIEALASDSAADIVMAAISGAASAQQDEELAMTAAAAVSGGPAPVTYFDSARVSAAFDKGAVLFNQGASYMVHASRREKAGMAEIHTKDADIVYVLEGTATLVTGGTAVNAKTTEPDELRGSKISGGETQQLKKGDVIIVPAGVPHWFKEVSNPFLYYVVKAR